VEVLEQLSDGVDIVFLGACAIAPQLHIFNHSFA
jgi:hypothetical protein